MTFKTIAFVRNPWERLVSQYKQFQRPYFLHHDKRRRLHEASLVSFEAFVKQYVQDPRPMWKFLTNQAGEVSVDYLGRFETLRSDFSSICDQLQLPSIKLDHLNPARGEKQRYQDYYSSQILETINPVLEKDARLFGYSFA